MPLHQYFWSITVKVRWCSFAPETLVCSGHGRNIWCNRKRTSKKKKIDAEGRKTQTHLHTWRRLSFRYFSLIQHTHKKCHALPVNTDLWGCIDTHNETCNLSPAVKMKSRNTKTIRSYDYDLLLQGCKIHACLLTCHKNVFPKVSIQ